jgi:hypothetical protein
VRGGIRRLERRTVMVHTKDGRSFRGVLVGVYRDSITLAHSATWSGRDQVALEGEAHVPRENISFLQTLSPEA